MFVGYFDPVKIFLDNENAWFPRHPGFRRRSSATSTELRATRPLHASASAAQIMRESVLLFSKINKMFVGYFDPEKIFLDNENA